ncbi:alpha/beta hydrolase [Nitriliruptor alkaliphilus]|uniref:alpha/beta hydrolase n=1 Tax=Nitriliruptor alkaliphilus TaxID=427918 RepID=UPI0006961767|nr:alpha/beta hydrolase [Nitriliruptor alkaliphilus]
MGGDGDGGHARPSRACRLVGQAGQAVAEYVAIVVVLAALVGTVAATGAASSLAASVSGTIAQGFCLIGGGDCARGDEGAADPRSTGAAGDGAETTRVALGPAAQREQETHRQLAEEADRLRELADRDLADLAVWDELLELEERRGNPTLSEDEQQRIHDRIEELRSQLDDAPDGSLLAELRDTEHVRGDPFSDPDDVERLLDALDRIARAEHADDLADLLQGWADSDRRFVHVEIDLDDGTVRIAEVVHGDLDDSAHVALVIPGTGNDGANFDTATRENARALADTLEHVPGGDDVSVIACLCYAPPPSLTHAGGSRHADAGGADLARIIGDLPVGDAQLHALGHSYGATALGRAVTRNDLEVDSTISLGGPGFGSGVRRVEDLPANAGQVWGVRHDLDPIALAGMHGRNPDRGSFGAHGFDIGDDGLDRRWYKPYVFDAHSIYYQDAESLENLALIVSGNPDVVTGYREGRR